MDNDLDQRPDFDKLPLPLTKEELDAEREFFKDKPVTLVTRRYLATLARRDQEICDLEDELKECSEIATQDRVELGELQRGIEELGQRAADAEARANENNNEVQRYLATIALRDLEISEYEEFLDAANELTRELDAELEQRKSSVEELEQLITDAEERANKNNNEVQRLQAGIREHRDSWLDGDNKCWLDNEKLYKLLPEGYTPPERDTLVELQNCERYIASCHDPRVKYVSPQVEIERLTALVKRAYPHGPSGLCSAHAVDHPVECQTCWPDLSDLITTHVGVRNLLIEERNELRAERDQLRYDNLQFKKDLDDAADLDIG